MPATKDLENKRDYLLFFFFQIFFFSVLIFVPHKRVKHLKLIKQLNK